MSDYSALILDDQALIEDFFTYSDEIIDPQAFLQYWFEAVYEDVFPPVDVVDYPVLLRRDIGPHDQIMERIYFFPEDPTSFEHYLDFGLITADETGQVRIWNAFFNTKKTITAINPTNPDGTIIEGLTPPVVLNGSEEILYDLTVTKEGPPFQNTTYSFIVGSLNFVLTISGERLQELDTIFEPDWEANVSLMLDFSTVIFENEVFKEQRRPLFPKAKKTQEADFLVFEADFQKAHNILKRSHDKVFFVPLFMEILTVLNNPIQGETVLDIEEEIDFYYFLKNTATVVLLKSIIDTTLFEYLIISSFGVNQITFESPISKLFVPGETVLIPVFVGRLKDFKPNYETDHVATFKLFFEELR